MGLHRVSRAEEIPPGQTRFFRVAGRPLVLANYEGRIHALEGTCPHRRNPLEGAQLWDNLLDCPWHHFQYDVRTGENHFPKNVYPDEKKKHLRSLKTYDVEIKEGEIWVNLA